MTGSRTSVTRTRLTSTVQLRYVNVQPQDGNDDEPLLEDWQTVWNQDPDVDIAPGDTITWRAVAYEVVGSVERWRRGRVGHTKFSIARRSALRDTVTVRTRLGDGATGPVYSDPLVVRCSIDDSRRLVTDGNGDEQVVAATLRLHVPSFADDNGTPVEVDPFTIFAPETELAVRGRPARVLTVVPILVDGHTIGAEVTTG